MVLHEVTEYSHLIIQEIKQIMEGDIVLQSNTDARYTHISQIWDKATVLRSFKDNAWDHECSEGIQSEGDSFVVGPPDDVSMDDELPSPIRSEYVRLLKTIHPTWEESISFLRTTGASNKLLALKTGNCHSNYALFCAYRLLWAAPHTVKMILYWNKEMGIPFHKCMILLGGTRHLWDIINKNMNGWLYLAVPEFSDRPSTIRALMVEEYITSEERGDNGFWWVIRDTANSIDKGDKYGRDIPAMGARTIGTTAYLFDHEAIYGFFDILTRKDIPTYAASVTKNQGKD